MTKPSPSIAALALAAMILPIGQAAYAQSGDGQSKKAAPPKYNPSALGDAAPMGRLTASHGKWRSSQLLSATVYNDKGLVLGTISDLMMSSSGHLDTAILSVSGTLGIGSKLVAVPFDQLKIVPSKVNPSHAGTPGTVATPKGAPEVTQSQAKIPTTPGASSATPSQNADFGIIYPGATRSSLRARPNFHFDGP